MTSTACVLGARHLGEVVTNKPFSLSAVAMGKTLKTVSVLVLEMRESYWTEF